MEVAGICTNCGQAGKMYTCSLCGGSFCKDCYDIRRRTCKSCRSGLRFKE